MMGIGCINLYIMWITSLWQCLQVESFCNFCLYQRTRRTHSTRVAELRRYVRCIEVDVVFNMPETCHFVGIESDTSFD